MLHATTTTAAACDRGAKAVGVRAEDFSVTATPSATTHATMSARLDRPFRTTPLPIREGGDRETVRLVERVLLEMERCAATT